MKNMEHIIQSASFIAQKLSNRTPEIVLILGSGLGMLAETIEQPIFIPYQDIPHFPIATVEGHTGRLVAGTLGGRFVICMQGRFHYYEGYDMDAVVYPIRVLREMGVPSLLVTNAAGGINRNYHAGDFMLIRDHIKMFADSPLRGANIEKFGPRFHDMSNAYDRDLRVLAHQVAKDNQILLHEGVYAIMGGPSFETPAEIRALSVLGADAVGMSTVPEVITAVHAGMRVMGISCITNMAAGILDQPLSHHEVMETAERIKHSFCQLVAGIVKEWR